MKPPSFEYVTPKSSAEAVSLLDEFDGEAKILAGGQSLMPLLNMRLARPGLLIDVARVDGLDYVRSGDELISIGAMTRQRSVEFADSVKNGHPFLHSAIMHIAHPQNRNQGTVGGSIAHADPAAELPAIALILGAKMKALGPDGERVIDATDFFETYLTTSLDFGEMLTEVSFPVLGPATGWSIQEVTRRHGDFALTGAMATARLDGSGHLADVRVVLFGVGATPLRATRAESVANGQKPSADVLRAAATAASQEIDEPLSDVHATAEFRRHLAAVLTRRAIEEAVKRAQPVG